MLTDIKCKTAKPKDKPYRLTDERGLYLQVQPSGAKYFRLKYRLHGKERTLALGVYPEVSLKEAREKRDEARRLLDKGTDPSAVLSRRAKSAVGAETFEAVAREWHAKFAPTWTPETARRVIHRLEQHAFPYLGTYPIREVTALNLLPVLRRIEERGTLDMAHRVKRDCIKLFAYAVATGKADRNPAQDLQGALPPIKTRHRASIIEPKAVGALLRAIDGYQGTLTVKCALQLAPLTFVRPTELRSAEWADIDFDRAEWRIPPHRMKMGKPHIVPLSSQALDILKTIHPLTGSGRYVFPSARSPARCMSENAILAALRRMGFTKDEMTGHGFRSMASSLLNEQGWPHDAIERQLAHSEPNSVRASYNFADHLSTRRRMMQAWADYLDSLKQGAVVIPFQAKA